jgi:hypothetical protein
VNKRKFEKKISLYSLYSYVLIRKKRRIRKKYPLWSLVLSPLPLNPFSSFSKPPYPQKKE